MAYLRFCRHSLAEVAMPTLRQEGHDHRQLKAEPEGEDQPHQ